MEITRDTFKTSDRDTQNLILYDSITAVGDKVDSLCSSCDQRHRRIDDDIRRSGRINKAISSGSGLIGGVIAFVTSKVFGM
jgi:hypothetical protein